MRQQAGATLCGFLTLSLYSNKQQLLVETDLA